MKAFEVSSVIRGSRAAAARDNLEVWIVIVRGRAAAAEDGRTPSWPRNPAKRRSSGFTLIELVISAALMAIILVSAYLCLRSGISGQKLIESRADLLQSARVAMALLSADLRCACPLSKEFDFLGMDRTVGKMEADNLDFATHNYYSRRLGEGDFCEISYFLDKNEKSGKFSLWRRRDPSPDSEPLSGGDREEIAEGLVGLKFEYYDGFDWYDEWGDPEGRHREQNSSLIADNLSGMPEAVRITLSFASDSESPKKDSEEKDTVEPPLIFQTVVRLNLAGSSWVGSSGGSFNNSTGTTAARSERGGRN